MCVWVFSKRIFWVFTQVSLSFYLINVYVCFILVRHFFHYNVNNGQQYNKRMGKLVAFSSFCMLDGCILRASRAFFFNLFLFLCISIEWVHLVRALLFTQSPILAISVYIMFTKHKLECLYIRDTFNGRLYNDDNESHILYVSDHKRI